MSYRFGLNAIIASSLLAVTFPATSHQASEGVGYAGGMFTQLTYDEDGVSNDAEPTALIGRLGYHATEYFAVEGRLGIGLADDSVPVTVGTETVDVDVELDRLFGAYAVGYLPLGDIAAAYGLVGITNAKATFSAGGFSDSDTDTGLSYGVGFEFYPSAEVGLNAEYVQYLDESGYDLSALSVGAKFLF
ncbi:porin family protein [Aquisalimonas sp.]|uniref:porin family protein n=1 Tax=unclassified Aquisalimonas TaxID=2644645 RepID=UPI0025C1188D|nr:porin family protein [Aquisalimonas sp.]